MHECLVESCRVGRIQIYITGIQIYITTKQIYITAIPIYITGIQIYIPAIQIYITAIHIYITAKQKWHIHNNTNVHTYTSQQCKSNTDIHKYISQQDKYTQYSKCRSTHWRPCYGMHAHAETHVCDATHVYMSCIYTFGCVMLYIYIYMCRYCIAAVLYMCVCHVYIHVYMSRTYTCVYVTYIYMCICHVYVVSCIYTCVCVMLHIHIHTYWSKETPPPGVVSYLLCSLTKNRE